MSDQGQALWQLSMRSAVPATGKTVDKHVSNIAGPQRFELRRLPIVRSMYEQYFDHFIDRVNPFELAQPAAYPDPNFRDFIAPMFAAMTMDSHHDLKEAWNAITSHPAFPTDGGMISTADVLDETLAAMIELFDAMPSIEGPNGHMISLTDANRLGEIRDGWLRGGWRGEGLWIAEASPADEMRRRFGEFFRGNYQRIVQLAKERSRGR